MVCGRGGGVRCLNYNDKRDFIKDAATAFFFRRTVGGHKIVSNRAIFFVQ